MFEVVYLNKSATTEPNELNIKKMFDTNIVVSACTCLRG